MAISGATVISKARKLLSDTVATYRWSDADLVGWLNSGQREIAILKPNSFAVPLTMQLAAGSVQTVPGLAFVKVIRNMGLAGTTPGTAPSGIDQEILDELYPGWHSVTAAASMKYFMFDNRSPNTFFCYPPQPDPAGYVQILQTPLPTDITIVTGTITGNIIGDIYETALIDYVVFRALYEDTENADFATADKYQQRFFNALGGKQTAEQSTGAATNAN